MRAFTRCDAIVVVGGGMFGPGLPPLVRILPWVLCAAARTGRDVALTGVGVYSGAPADTLVGLRCLAASDKCSVTVRDEKSARQLAGARLVPCIGDLARYVEPAPRAAVRAILQAAGVPAGKPLLLLAPKSGTTGERTDAVVASCVAAARHWLSCGGVVAGIAFGDQADYGIPAARHDGALIERIGGAIGVRLPIFGPDLQPSFARGLVAEATAVVAHRFHGLVFADAAGVPAAGYAWEPKSAALIAEHGLFALSDPLASAQLVEWLDRQIPVVSARHGGGD